jgi:hypothetical protein
MIIFVKVSDPYVPLGEHVGAIDAFQAEGAALVAALGALGPAPWSVGGLTGHLVTTIGRVPAMVAGPAPERPDTTAESYYRGDERFSAAANAERIAAGEKRAGEGHDELAATLRAAGEACAGEPEDRVVSTRHGDAMLLEDFLTTRVVELALHGLDLADALGREPWLTAEAADHVLELFFGRGRLDKVVALGLGAATTLRLATGRAEPTDDQKARLKAARLRPLTFG